jgi:site-specific DNA-methyltransferase (adenine-specific)
VKPTYARGNVKLYLADCRAVLPELEAGSVGSVVTDPPWELSDSQVEIRGNGVGPVYQKSTTLKRGTVGEFDASVIGLCQDVCEGDCLFLAGYKELADLINACRGYRGTFVWHKPNAPPAAFYPARIDVSFIVWTAKKSALYGHQHWKSMVFRVNFPQAGCFAEERIVDENGKAIHPCQGPLSLYRQLIEPLQEPILDCYLGSGTSGVAAVCAGKAFVGVEHEERYFSIACKRIDAAFESFALYEPVPQAVQGTMFPEGR